MRITLTTFLLLAAAAFGGCSSSIVAPTAQVKAISLVEQSPQAARVQVTVELTSENSVPLPLLECAYTVTVEGIGTFSFVDRPNKSIPAKRTDINGGPATQLVSLLAAIATQGKDAKGAACRVSGSLMYEPPGEIRKVMTETYVPLPRIMFSSEAKLE